MSVPAWSRDVNLTAILDKAIELVAYTIKVTGSDKNIPRRHHFELGTPLVNLAREIMHLTQLAERRRNGSAEDLHDRLIFYNKAIDCEECLKAELNMNLRVFSLKADRAKYFDDLITNWHKLCIENIRRDRNKLNELGK